ncbi:hypothetical protein FB451DRAFT_979743, partial [Mycena latifolia]
STPSHRVFKSFSMTYTNGIAPIVTVYGPGNLHHLSYASNGGIPNVVGIIPTASEGTSNFLLGFSYTFTGYAFYWDGTGMLSVNLSFMLEPVGTSWTDATSVPWGNEIVLGANVQAQVATAVNRDHEVTAFFIPD